MDLEFREEILELLFWIWAIDSRRLPIIRLIFPLALSTARAHKLRKEATSFTFSSNLSIDYTNKKMGWKSLTFFRSFSFSVQKIYVPFNDRRSFHVLAILYYSFLSLPIRLTSQAMVIYTFSPYILSQISGSLLPFLTNKAFIFTPMLSYQLIEPLATPMWQSSQAITLFVF